MCTLTGHTKSGISNVTMLKHTVLVSTLVRYLPAFARTRQSSTGGHARKGHVQSEDIGPSDQNQRRIAREAFHATWRRALLRPGGQVDVGPALAHAARRGARRDPTFMGRPEPFAWKTVLRHGNTSTPNKERFLACSM